MSNISVLMKRSLVYRDRGKFARALEDFTRATELSPRYAEAHREKGIAENKLFMSELRRRSWKPSEENVRRLVTEGVLSGETSLRNALELNPAPI